MGSDINSCNFTGNLTKDADLRFSNSGMAICKFSIAVNKKMKDNESTSFFNCIVFGKFGEAVAKYLVKGTPVSITAEAKQNVYEKDGVKHYSIDFIVNSLRMFGNKQNNGTNQQSGNNNQQSANNAPQGQQATSQEKYAQQHDQFDDDGIPF